MGIFSRSNKKSSQNNITDARTLFEQAKKEKDPKLAVDLYSDAIENEKNRKNPDKNLLSEIYQSRGELYLNLQVATLSQSDCMHAIDYNPENADAYNILGIWYTIPHFAKPEWESALKLISKAIDLDRTRPDYFMNYAVVLIEKGEREEGKEILESLVEKGYADAKIALKRYL